MEKCCGGCNGCCANVCGNWWIVCDCDMPDTATIPKRQTEG